jgi:hypothetical protein
MNIPRLLAPLLALAPTTLPAAPETVSIPLYHVLEDGGGHRLGIYAALGGSPVAKLYEVDTGSTGFYGARAEWWPNARVIGPGPNPQSYGSGVSYEYDIVETTVDFGHGAKTGGVRAGRITRATGPGLTPRKWNHLVKQDIPPLHGAFFGNMGSGLEHKNGMFAIIPQLPGNLSTGFIIETRGLVRQGQVNRPVRQGQILVGLTDEIRRRFEIQIPMRALTTANGAPVFFPSGYQTREQYLLDVTVTLSRPGSANFSTSMYGLLDSGASTPNYRTTRKTPLPKEFADGNHLKTDTQLAAFAAGRGDWNWTFDPVFTPPFRSIAIESKGQPNTNLGNSAFFEYDVMYDLQRGILGLHRIPGRPRVTINGPANRTTAAARTRIAGAASSPTGIQSVRYRINRSPHWRRTSGTAIWQFTARLKPGINHLRIAATNRVGQIARRSLTITRD